MDNPPILLFGGSFDPPHNGHLAIATQAAALFQHSTVHFIPTANAWQKGGAQASTAQRITMLEKLLENALFPYFINRIEIDNESANSYSIETLSHLRLYYGAERPLIWLLGSDQWRNISSWHRYQELFALCHFCVFHRPNTSLLQDVNNRTDTLALGQHTKDFSQLYQQPAGYTYFVNESHYNEASSTIREQKCYDMIPQSVKEYILQQGLY